MHGETPGEAAVRELREETGLEIAESDLTSLRVKTYTDTDDDPVLRGEQAEVHVFFIEIKPGINVECREGQGIARLRIRSELDPHLSRDTNRPLTFTLPSRI